MLAALNSSVASQHSLITPALVTATRYGFNTGGAGALDPGTFKGAIIEQLTSPDIADLFLQLSVDNPGAFAYIRVVDTAGSVRVYTAASGYSGGGFYSWGTGSDRVYTGTTARDITIG